MEQWSDLLEEIVEIIVRKLELPADVLNFSAVCKPWHSVSMEYMYHRHTNIPFVHFKPKRCPLPMLLVPFADGPEMHNLFSINEQKNYNGLHIPELKDKWICGSSRGWLVTVDKIDRQMHLLNPIERKQILLPHMSTFRMPLCHVYHHEMNECWSAMKANVLFGASDKLEDCVVVAIITTLGRICYCRIGDDKWTDVYMSPIHVSDIITYNDLLYVADSRGTLLSTDIRTQRECTVITGGCPMETFSTCYLVESPAGLLSVVRNQKPHDTDKETISFRVFRLIKRACKDRSWYALEDRDNPQRIDATHDWVEMESIGDWLIFVGYNYSLCLDSRLYPASKRNCIYFADHEFDFDTDRFCLDSPDTPHDIGVYHLQEKRVENLTGLSKLANHHAVWLSPSM